MRVSIAAIVVGLLVSSGCAFGQKYAFSTVRADVTAQGSAAISVATHDRRDEIVKGKEDTKYVGMQRAGFGNPYDVETESGRPLSDEMSDAICESLNARGFQATPIVTTPRHSDDEVRMLVLDGRRPIGLILSIDQWVSDTYTNITVRYDLELSVIDGSGRPLARARAEEKRHVEGSFWNPTGAAKKEVPKVFAEVLGRLLNDPGIASALTGR